MGDAYQVENAGPRLKQIKKKITKSKSLYILLFGFLGITGKSAVESGVINERAVGK